MLPRSPATEGSAPIDPEFPRLSSSLLEFLAPYLDVEVGIDPGVAPDVLREHLHLAWMAWNCGAPGAASDPAWCDVRDRVIACGVPEIADAFRALVARRRDVFGDDPRQAGEMQIETAGGTIDRLVVPTADSPALRVYLAASRGFDPRSALHPTFRAFVRRHGFDHRFLSIAIPAGPHADREWTRRRVPLGWRGDAAAWDAPPLADLFRGDAPAPPDEEVATYPDSLFPLLVGIDQAFLMLARAEQRDPLDREVTALLAALREDPDGPGTGFAFDVVWQHVAVELALAAWSRPQLAAVLRHMERAAARDRADPASCRHVARLRRAYARAQHDPAAAAAGEQPAATPTSAT